MTGEAADSLHDHLKFLLLEESGSKMLDQVVQNEKTKLLTLLDLGVKGLLESFSLELENDFFNELLVSLKQRAQ